LQINYSNNIITDNQRKN